MQDSKNMFLAPITRQLATSLNLPGSKSIANRVLPLAALANGISIIHNVPDVAEDVQLMLQALTALGVKLEKLSSASNLCSSYKIYGVGGNVQVKKTKLFLGNSGTSLRFLCAILAMLDGDYQLTGISRMCERPIGDLVLALQSIGGQINYLANTRYPPLEILAFVDNLQQQIMISGKTSSQFVSALLMGLSLLKREISVVIKDDLISKPYVMITQELLKLFGVGINNSMPNRYTISGKDSLKALEYTIEPDASSASYFLAMAALSGQVEIKNLAHNSLQGDKEFATVLAQMGAEVLYAENSIIVRAKELNALEVDMTDMPDVAMTIAILALFSRGTTTIHGIQSWKVKETDRLLAMYIELTKLGATVSYSDSSIMITPPVKINEMVAIDTYNDHRMAMCFSLVAVAGVPVIINDYNCVAKTFANYFTVFKQLFY